MGRHAHEHGGGGKMPHDLGRIEARQQSRRATREPRTAHCDDEPMHVRERECVQQHVVRRETPERANRLQVARQVAVREHRALRLAGRAGGVEQQGEVVGRARMRRDSRGKIAGDLHERAVARGVERQRDSDFPRALCARDPLTTTRGVASVR